ncbi:MAG: universal stress protein [Deltaproteobacteria bacterium]|nr:universal stress protein [Deltaproteobacteria bacterium]
MRILVATDGSEFSRKTAEFVVRMGRVLELEIELTQVVDMHRVEYKMLSDLYVDMIREGAKDAAERILQREVAFYEEQGMTVSPRVLFGSPGPALCDAVASDDFGLLVLGRKGQGGDIQDLLFGSVSNYTVHHAKKPVLVVKGRGPFAQGEEAKRPLRALIAMDGSVGAKDCLKLASELRPAEGLEVSLLAVIDPERPGFSYLTPPMRYEALATLHRDAEAMLRQACEVLREAGHTVSTRVEEGTPAKTICRVYREDEFEIVLMGRKGVGQLDDAIFGSVSTHVLHHCPGHVLLVP